MKRLTLSFFADFASSSFYVHPKQGGQIFWFFRNFLIFSGFSDGFLLSDFFWFSRFLFLLFRMHQFLLNKTEWITTIVRHNYMPRVYVQQIVEFKFDSANRTTTSVKKTKRIYRHCRFCLISQLKFIQMRYSYLCLLWFNQNALHQWTQEMLSFLFSRHCKIFRLGHGGMSVTPNVGEGKHAVLTSGVITRARAHGGAISFL